MCVCLLSYCSNFAKKKKNCDKLLPQLKLTHTLDVFIPCIDLRLSFLQSFSHYLIFKFI